MIFSIFKKINNFANRRRWLDYIAIFFARYLPYIMVAFLLIYSIYKREYNLFIYPVICGVFSRFVINEIVHLIYKRIRPAHLPDTKILIPVPKNYSFPSGHTSFFFGISFLLFFYNYYLALFFVICSSLIGIARVFCGVHWFRDILAGVMAGGFSSLIFHQLINYLWR